MGHNPHTTSFVSHNFTSLTLNYQQPNTIFPSNWITVNQQHNIFNVQQVKEQFNGTQKST